MLRSIRILALAALLAGGCQKEVLPRDYALDQAPSELRYAAAEAESTIAFLQRRLAGRLKAELDRAGAASAVAVCRDSAQIMTADAAAAWGIRVGRTSHRLRNPGNAPRPWAEPFVAAVDSGAKASEVKTLLVDLDDRVGVLQPIATTAVCLQCHGDPDSLAPDLVAVLREAYPQDRAVGFAEGDLRGFFWAEAPRRR
jgi:hypothetical protein